MVLGLSDLRSRDMKKRIRHGDPQRGRTFGRGGAAVEGRRPSGAAFRAKKLLESAFYFWAA